MTILMVDQWCLFENRLSVPPKFDGLMIMSMLKLPPGYPPVPDKPMEVFVCDDFSFDPPKQAQFVNPWVLHCNHESLFVLGNPPFLVIQSAF